jgi:N-methylhydantoinase A/oxoprolinase/acetone carboxylase beta subunit
MGGTTAKAALIDNGEAQRSLDFEVARVDRFRKGSGLPLKVPVIDMIEIGAGGGSIARVDRLGLVRVGPESASSDPGPACYGLGGARPTVTDADLVLGYLGAESFLGGAMKLDVAAAEAALAEHIGKPLTAVPDPFGKFDSFGAHNNARLRAFLDHFGFDYEFLSATECYRAGRFDATLLLKLHRYEAVMAIMLPSLREERAQRDGAVTASPHATQLLDGAAAQLRQLCSDWERATHGTEEQQDESARTLLAEVDEVLAMLECAAPPSTPASRASR